MSSGSDSDGELVRVTSTPLPPPKWDRVPEEKEFKFKFRLTPAGKRKRRGYTLKRGVNLPYTTDIQGLKVTFEKTLEPTMDGHIAKIDGDYWTFEAQHRPGMDFPSPRTGSSSDLGNIHAAATTPKSGTENVDSAASTPKSGTEYIDSAASTPKSGTGNRHSAASTHKSGPSNRSSKVLVFGSLPENITDVDLEPVETLDIQDEVYSECDPAMEKVVIHNLGSNGIVQMKCALCSFVSETLSLCKTHIAQEHPNWKVEVTGQEEKNINSPHTAANRNWLPELIGNFHQIVISKCSQKCQDAVQSNKAIDNPREWNEVFDQIFNTTIDYLEEKFGGVSVPRLCDMREVIATLGHIYPAMFRQSIPESEPELLSGFVPVNKVLGLNTLAQRMIDRFRGRAKKRRQRENPAAEEDNPPKRGKPKQIYGVDNKKFSGKKATGEVIAAIAKTKDMDDVDEIESIFEKNRPSIQYQFLNSSNSIHRICKRFFKSSLHLTNQFTWLTNSPALTIAVRENLIVQIEHLEKYLKYFDKSVEFVEKLASIETTCEVDYDGSKLFKYIQVLSLAGSYLDSDGTMFIRLESDGPMKTGGPYIMAVEVNKKFHFEIHVEKELLLANLDLPEAVAGFLHLAFVLNLKYAKECQTLIDIMQRLAAKYGDDSGTRTNRSKVAAQSKFDKYLSGLGRVLAST